MKAVFVIFLLISFCYFGFGEELNGYYYGIINPFLQELRNGDSLTRYYFNGEKYNFSTIVIPNTKAKRDIPAKYIIDSYYEEEGIYKIKNEGNLKVIEFFSKSEFTYKKRLGILYNDRRIFLYDDGVLFFMPDEDLRWEGLMPTIEAVKASSFLKEKDVFYTGESYIPWKNKYIIPWVEGVPGDGIGEWIELSIKNNGIPMSSLYIVNGFVSFNNPSLFEKNSRVSKIKIESHDGLLNEVYILKDIPDIQEIRLPFPIKTSIKLKITILDIYKGNKWEDTCVSMIVPMGDLPTNSKN
jgi:hypothetical protein